MRNTGILERRRERHLFGELVKAASSKGLSVTLRDGKLFVCTSDRRVALARRHLLYAFDVVADFDHYFGAVLPDLELGSSTIDFSATRLQRYPGFPDYDVLTPSLAEPIATTDLYIKLGSSRIAPGATVLDLGSYSGLSSILFMRQVGPMGRVIAVEADPLNAMCSRVNFQSERLLRGSAPELEEAAVWSSHGYIRFSAEGSMGASAVDLVGEGRGTVREVPTMRLSDLADRYGLTRVDFVKMDIEGAEVRALQDDAFVNQFRPQFVIEVHSRAILESCSSLLGRLEYAVFQRRQPGCDLMLLDCHPA